MLVWVMALYGGVEAIVGQMIEPFALWPQHGPFRRGGGGGGRVLDLAVGAGRLAAFHAAHHVFRGAGPACREPEIPEVMLGDRPALKTEESLYLRMLAEDPDDATEDAEDFLRDSTLRPITTKSRPGP